MNWRAILLTLALLAALLLAFWPQPDEEGAVVGPAARSRPTAPAGPATDLRFAALAGDLFPAQTWRPPPPRVRPVAPPEPEPEAPPEPPAFPFDYAGRWAEAGEEVIFLEQGERLLRARPGEVVDGTWRLDRMEAAGLVFTYLPLDMEKTLRIDR